MAKETTFDKAPKGHAGALGYDDGNDQFVVAAVDADGRLEVVLPYEEALGARVYNYDGSDWVRSNLLFGYHDVLNENMGGTATGANYNKYSSVVQTGEIWVVQGISIRNNTRNATLVQLYIVQPTTGNVFLSSNSSPAQYIPDVVLGQFVLGAGAKMGAWMGGTVAGDVIEGGVWGYKMQLDM